MVLSLGSGGVLVPESREAGTQFVANRINQQKSAKDFFSLSISEFNVVFAMISLFLTGIPQSLPEWEITGR